MAGELPFEKPLVELQDKIKELRRFTEEKGIDFSDEVARLEQKAKDLAQQIYGNLTPWQRVQLARHSERPTTLDFIQHIFTDFLEVHGDRLFGDDLAIVGGIAKLDGRPVTVVGHQKGKDTKDNIKRNFGMAHPEGFRKALRIMQQADKFRRPIITFINTAGAYPGKSAEERGISEAVARNLREMAVLGVPVICIVIGEGGSGGALAIGVGNRVYMLENTYYSVIAPESAAAILWKDSSLGMRAAESMKITAPDLLQLGVIDGIIEEPFGGAHRDVSLQAQLVKAKILEGLAELDGKTPEELVQDRYNKFKQIGEYASL
jgi:acetyl-CoA carboxylase carboxyl transferase subunit alpha